MIEECLLDTRLSFCPKFSELLALLSKEDQTLLMRHSKISNYSQGTIIYEEGGIPVAINFLNKGKVKIFKNGIAGRKQIVRLIKPGWFFGYRALLAEDEFYQSSSQVFEDAQIIAIPKEIINDLIRRNHKLSNLFIHILASDLGKSNGHTVILTQKHLRGRLASALLILNDIYGLEKNGKTLSARMSRVDLAELANMNIANTSRMIGEFVQEGIISVQRRVISILDQKALQHISEIG